MTHDYSWIEKLSSGTLESIAITGFPGLYCKCSYRKVSTLIDPMLNSYKLIYESKQNNKIHKLIICKTVNTSAPEEYVVAVARRKVTSSHHFVNNVFPIVKPNVCGRCADLLRTIVTHPRLSSCYHAGWEQKLSLFVEQPYEIIHHSNDLASAEQFVKTIRKKHITPIAEERLQVERKNIVMKLGKQIQNISKTTNYTHTSSGTLSRSSTSGHPAFIGDYVTCRGSKYENYIYRIDEENLNRSQPVRLKLAFCGLVPISNEKATICVQHDSVIPVDIVLLSQTSLSLQNVVKTALAHNQTVYDE